MDSLNRIVVCPYTLMEEEALAGAVLLFDQVLLLHPYPLPLPRACLPAVEQGRLKILTLPRTPEEIREKGRVLRELERYSSHLPGREYLKYLAGAAIEEDQETQEEILAALRGKGKAHLPGEGKAGLDGSLVLCGIHMGMLQEWEVDQALAEVEDLERGMIRILMGEEEAETPWKTDTLTARGRRGFELHSPSAFKAWQEMKRLLIPEPLPWITDQPWVLKEHYGLDPEDHQTLSLPLPRLPSLSGAMDLASRQPLLKIKDLINDLLDGPLDRHPKGLTALKEAFSALGLTEEGTYSLVLPPPWVEGEEKEKVFLLAPDES